MNFLFHTFVPIISFLKKTFIWSPRKAGGVGRGYCGFGIYVTTKFNKHEKVF